MTRRGLVVGGLLVFLGRGPATAAGLEQEVLAAQDRRIALTVAGDIEVKLRFTELCVRQGGAWKMALWQSTRVPDPAP